MSESRIVKISHQRSFDALIQYGRPLPLEYAKRMMKPYRFSQEQWGCLRSAFIAMKSADYKHQSVTFFAEGFGDEIIIVQNGQGTFNGTPGKFDIAGLIKNAKRYRIPSMEEDHLLRIDFANKTNRALEIQDKNYLLQSAIPPQHSTRFETWMCGLCLVDPGARRRTVIKSYTWREKSTIQSGDLTLQMVFKSSTGLKITASQL